MLLSREQRLGAAILFGTALIAWFVVAVWPSRQPEPKEPHKHRRSWEERKDSMRLADSLRYVQWAAEREQRYDSFRMADSMRREEWKRIRQQQYDSFRLADSLWRDSVGWWYAKHVKKDTILDLNHCDTTDLQFIRGIGHFTAVQIIRYREALGGYYSPVQLTDTTLAQCRLDTLLNHFTVDTSAILPIRVNSCSIDRLQRHPYLRYHQAKDIYTLRRQRVRLHSIDDLRSLPSLSEDDLRRIAPYLSFE